MSPDKIGRPIKKTQHQINYDRNNLIDQENSKKIKKLPNNLNFIKKKNSLQKKQSPKTKSLEDRLAWDFIKSDGEMQKGSHFFQLSSSSKHQIKAEDLSLRDYLDDCRSFEENELINEKNQFGLENELLEENFEEDDDLLGNE